MLPEQTSVVATTAPASQPGLQHAGPAFSCTNCGAAVTGRYCGNCGQRLEHAIHSVWHFTREATEDLTHADSRLWTTLFALMLKPGFLTREFLTGRRARYLPPLRLYLVLSVVFFLAISSSDRGPRIVALNADSRAALAEAAETPIDVRSLAAKPGETPQQHSERVCKPDYTGPGQSFLLPFMQKGCRNLIENRGRTVAEAFMHNVARAMFLFLPVLALIMTAMYWHPRRYYVEHLLFFVHTHAFAFLLLALLTVLSRLLPNAAGSALVLIVWLYIPYYLFVAMRRVYGQSRSRTLTKLVVLSCAYFFGISIMLVLTGMYSVWSL